MKKFKSKVLCMFVSSLVFSSGLLALTSDSFVIGVKTDNLGISADNQFTIPTYSGSTYNYSVDCDSDGSYEATGVDGNYTCSFPIGSDVARTIIIDGTFPRIYFNNEGDVGKLTTVEQWGTQQWESMEKAFFGARNLQYVPNTPAPDLSAVTDMSYMFGHAVLMNNSLNSWDTANIKNMNTLFFDATAFNGNISDWNTSTVTSMFSMFNKAKNFNQNIASWDVSQVSNISNMFASAEKFNQDIGDWNVGNVTNMSSLFSNNDLFSQDIGMWNVSEVMRMNAMLPEANLSVSDYDHILHEWSKLLLRNGVIFDAGNSHYCNGLVAKDAMISQHGWTINDAGENCDFYIDTPYLQTVQPGAPQKVVSLSTHRVSSDPVSYSIVGGSDIDKFFLSTSNGSELYIYSTDIDNPGDNNKDNIYRVRIRAVSGSYSDQRTIRVKVSNNTVLVPVVYYLLQ